MQALRGQVNLERMLSRKPLHDAEKQAAPATVCVTGEPAGGRRDTASCQGDDATASPPFAANLYSCRQADACLAS